MRIELDFLFDDEGWVLPILLIDGEPPDVPLDAERIAQDDDNGLKLAGLDPREVRRRWDENLGMSG